MPSARTRRARRLALAAAARLALATAAPAAASAATGPTVSGPIRAGVEPIGMAVNPAANTIYTADEGTGTVSVIDGRTNTVTTVRVETEPTGVAVNQRTGPSTSPTSTTARCR